MIPEEKRKKKNDDAKRWRKNNPERSKEIAQKTYQKNREKTLARVAERNRLHPEIKKSTDKKYRESHKEKASEYGKEYNLKNKEKLSQQKKEYREKNKGKIAVRNKENYWKTHTPFVPKHEQLGMTKKEYKKLLDKQYNESHKEEIKQQRHENYLKNKDKVKGKGKKYRLENKEVIRERKKKYYLDHPEIKLASDVRQLTKLGFPLNLEPFEYQFALKSWSKTVKKLGNGLCQICPSPATVSHHILHKSKYPGLSLNVNNGIPLCNDHHYESHGWN